ncbi:MAG: hypothetical protein NTY77_03510 [Elusimicrobia bacterium]|nr:hypothetical protein [Elusimicrobiota bacterium]
MATLPLLLLGLCLSVQADPPDAPSQLPELEGQPAQPAASIGKPGPAVVSDTEDQPASRPMSLADARMNFATVVESFIAAHSPDGYWPLKQKSTGKALKLRFESILPDSVREIQDGRFMGRAVLRDVEANIPVKADFTVDFSGHQWQVESLSLVSAAPRARKPPRKAPARRPAAGRSPEPR